MTQVLAGKDLERQPAKVVHMTDASPEFRLGSVLATSFTATLTERRGDPVERIPTAERLADWLAVSGLAVQSCTQPQL